MIGREKRVLLRHYLEQGMTKAAIARHVGVSRDTIYRWIATGQLDRDLDEGAVRYRPRPSVPSKLDPNKAIIEARLAEYPKLTATRLFKEVREAGYPGSYSQVKRYVRRVRPRPPEEPVQRFETPPGHQGQVDFADFRLPWGKRHALIVVLGYSRLLWLRYYERQTMPVVMRGLDSAFRYFGGVPSELLFDQMKAVIIEDGVQRAVGWSRTRSSCASAITGASGSGHAAPTGRRRRARWNGRSGTSARASSMAGTSSPTTISTPVCSRGSTVRPTSGCTAR